MQIITKWEECNSADSQYRTQQAIACLERLYGNLPGYIDMHPVGEYCIVHKQFGYATWSYQELFTMFNVTVG